MLPQQRQSGTEAPRRSSNRAPLLSLVTAGVLLIALLGSIWWGIGQREDKDAAEHALEQEQSRIAQNASQTNAIAYRLNATPNGPELGSGTAFMPLTGSGLLNVINIDPLPPSQTLQLWYFVNDETPPIPGGTFTIDAEGTGFMLIPADVGSFSGIGVSSEPEGGSTSPTTPMMLQGSVSASRG